VLNYASIKNSSEIY